MTNRHFNNGQYPFKLKGKVTERWETDQKAVSDAQSNLDGLITDWNKYQKKLDLERQVKDFEDAKKRNEYNINAQIKNLEDLSSAWSESLDISDDITSYKGDLKKLVGAEGSSFEERLALARQFAEDYANALAGLGAPTGGKTHTVGKDGNAPTGTRVGDVVQTQGGTYQVVSAGTSGAKYNPDSGLYSIKINDKRTYATGGIADYTGIAQLDGTPSNVETIFNAKQGKKLYDFINNVPDMTQFVVGKLMKSFSSIPLKSSATGVVNLSVGDIYLNGVQDTNGLSKAIVQKLPNQIIKDLFKR